MENASIHRPDILRALLGGTSDAVKARVGVWATHLAWMATPRRSSPPRRPRCPAASLVLQHWLEPRQQPCSADPAEGEIRGVARRMRARAACEAQSQRALRGCSACIAAAAAWTERGECAWDAAPPLIIGHLADDDAVSPKFTQTSHGRAPRHESYELTPLFPR
jgi:hypothetical protein